MSAEIKIVTNQADWIQACKDKAKGVSFTKIDGGIQATKGIDEIGFWDLVKKEGTIK